MSIEIRSARNPKTGGFYSIVQTDDGRYFYVDTSETWDHGWETMAFPCDKEGHVLDWGEVACSRYEDVMEAMEGHDQMVEHLEEHLFDYGGEETEEEDFKVVWSDESDSDPEG